MAFSNVWYHLFPLGFLDAEPRNPNPGGEGGPDSHRLCELTDWLDILTDLGVDGILLGPIGESQTHGYDGVDPYRVDRRLGSDDDFARFVDACRRRSIRVALDLVLNHVGRQHPYFLDVLEYRERSKWVDWFLIDFQKDGYDGFAYENFEGHGELVKLNHANPAVLNWATDMARCWIERGVSGFRLDAAYAISPQFLSDFSAILRDQADDVLLVGEMIHGDYPGFVQSTGLDTVTQYELWKAIWSSLNDGNFYELAHAFGRHNEFCERFVPWTFVGNHDTTRIATILNDARHRPHALVILLTIPGRPAIYAGDEQGAEGTKYDREGGDAEIREPPPFRPDELLKANPNSWTLHKRLIAIRRERPWLIDGRLTVHQLSNRQLVYQVSANDNRLVVALNLDDTELFVESPQPLGLLAGEATGESGTLRVPPRGWAVWE